MIPLAYLFILFSQKQNFVSIWSDLKINLVHLWFAFVFWNKSLWFCLSMCGPMEIKSISLWLLQTGACNRVNGCKKYDQTNAVYICIYFWIFSSFKSSLYHNAFAVCTHVLYTENIKHTSSKCAQPLHNTQKHIYVSLQVLDAPSVLCKPCFPPSGLLRKASIM